MDKKLIDYLNPGSTILVQISEGNEKGEVIENSEKVCKFMIVYLGPKLGKVMKEAYPNTVTVIDLDTGILTAIPRGLEVCVLEEK
jgi:hypothetical protein